MKKKILLPIIISLIVLSITGGVIYYIAKPSVDEAKMKEVYHLAKESGFNGNYEEWLETIKGLDGTSITNVSINDKNELLITLSNDRVINCGNVLGPKGDTGNGISSIIKTSTNGEVDIYTIYYTNGTNTSFSISNGINGIQGIQGEKGEDGHTPVITIGENGNWYIDGVDTTKLALGVKGETGNGISNIDKTSTNGEVDTYTITFTNGETTTFTVTNGEQGIQGIQGEKGVDGHTPVITIGENGNWFIDGVDTTKLAIGIQGETGNGISSIIKTNTEGLVDTYTITFTNGGTTTFTVTNGEQGYTPYIGENGNWFINGIDTGKNAIIIPKTYTITFNKDNGEEIFTEEVKEFYKINKPSDPIKDNHTFIGWYNEYDELWNFGGYDVTKDMTLTAKYRKNIYTYTLLDGLTTNSYSIEYENDINLPTCTKEGYTFIKWVDEKGDYVSNKFLYTTDKTFTAIYKKNITISFDNIDTPINSINTHDGYIIDSLEVPTKNGCDFLGWYYNEQLVEVGYVVNSEIDITLSAKWAISTKDFEYNTLIDNTLEILSYNGTSKEIYIPSTIDNKVVSTIGNDCFKNNTNIEKIVLSDSIITVKNNVFDGCTSLKEVVFNKDIDNYGDQILKGCTSLEKISISCINKDLATFFDSTDESVPNTFTKIELLADIANTNISTMFATTKKIVNVFIHDGVDAINAKAFYQCSNIQYISIPNSVVTIGNEAFRGCSSLSNVVLPDSITYIGNYAFYGCSSIKRIVIPKNLKSINNYTFASCTNLNNITISDKVTNIGSYAFSDCTALSSIDLPDSIINIDTYAFSNCIGITNIIIPDSVQSIKTAVFNGCYNLESITLPFTGGKLDSNLPFGHIFGQTSYENSLEITQSYQDNGYYKNTYYIPKNLSTVIITKDTNISYGTFYNCSNLKTVFISSKTKTIQGSAFYNCTGLTNIIIPKTVGYINSYAFDNCDNLTLLCEATSEPSTWNFTPKRVVWGYIVE